MGFFNLFDGNNTTSIEEYLDKDAIVVDVRTVHEFARDHVEGSKNIPLNAITSQFKEMIELGKPIITCCHSGARSGSAANILKQNGIDAINGGPWQNVDSCIKK